ncbi:AbrB family transcriptional regulator [Planococcus antarcticus DSM 14505]|uniref:AbrB family transcriptional regulator n=1 Tax=Planococcus antarcticus DSM 14505 TaxID=1185653 RepID=A0A1C7DDJ2_9BACL|nr:AbrB/MazE/SpoVT family DNA-binding domain-containing protein [Planococcus antarcticus]ANU09508.1 hypothetical protein BBH88_03895 [Planococcus antarcticus DSM 14505]EIM06288.1 AbrB family transcriptional regulator [Planococcus antarcticus DSM 14505]
MPNVQERSQDKGMAKHVRLRSKGQVTIPNEILEQLDLTSNTNLKVTVVDGRIVLIPMIEIAKDQAWYWTETWQQDEKEAQQEIGRGMTSGPLAVEDALAWLEADE